MKLKLKMQSFIFGRTEYDCAENLGRNTFHSGNTVNFLYTFYVFGEAGIREMESWSAALSCDGSMRSAYLSENYERFVFPLFYADLYRYFLCYSLAVF